VGSCEVNSSGSGCGPEVVTYGLVNALPGSVKGGGLLNYILKKNSAPWIPLVT